MRVFFNVFAFQRWSYEEMQGIIRKANVYADPGATAAATDAENRQMSEEELREELRQREQLMQDTAIAGKGETDQWRINSEIIDAITDNGKPLRLCIQASAGTGKSFVLEAVYLWCVLHGHKVEACAPTGIAAARLRVDRTPINAVTIHHLFALNIALESKIDPSKSSGDKKTARLTHMTVLTTDELSMVDNGAWLAMEDKLTTVGAIGLKGEAAGKHPFSDGSGRTHINLAF